MKTDYEKQAIDFMEKTGTKIKIEYEKYDYHFMVLLKCGIYTRQSSSEKVNK